MSLKPSSNLGDSLPANSLSLCLNPVELRAEALSEMLSGRAPSQPLDPESRRRVDALVLAYRQGNKQKVFQLNQEFYQLVLQPGLAEYALALVIERIEAQSLSGHGDFQIVIDSLKGQLSLQAQIKRPDLTLDQALVILLLSVTRSDKNSISYLRTDAQTGKPRPTTFPLTETLLRNFLAPFGDKVALLKRALILSRGLVLGNPAAWIAQDVRQRRKEHADALARQASLPGPAVAKPPAATAIQEVRIICDDLARILEGCQPDEKSALIETLQPEPLMGLIRAAKEPAAGKDFGQVLTSMYAKRLSRSQASLLSARLASRMKRMLTGMDGWKDEFWAEFQSLMQVHGVWEGEAWLQKWREVRQGKQHLARSGQDYLVAEDTTTVDDLLAQADKIKDKQRGRHMLSEPEIWTRPETVSTSPEQRRVLAALSRPERLDELIELASQTLWQELPERLRQRLYSGFCLLGDTDFDTIKTQYLATAPPEHADLAKHLIASLELRFNQVVALFKKDLRMNFAQALLILAARQQEEDERARKNSKEFLNSPAASYGRYGQG
ncbi:MAG: hypothetical protein CVV27_07400 [Candidatus Melainabacteria bacterium HGW-Melainabacteria-1]|nr:MAG: hypothetical protein CVV27_07400 [Candidatus Melainabacteria bacterium HGW-Melainabacteria-1]